MQQSSRRTMRASFALHADMFLPSPIFRATKEAQALRNAGFSCSAVCWIKDDASLPPEVEMEGVDVQRFFFRPRSQRLANLPGRYLDLRRTTRELSNRLVGTQPDLLVPHDLEVLSAGIRAARRRGVPVVYDAHEDWPSMVGETSRLEGALSAFLERRLCRHVSAVVTPSEMITDRFRGWGVRAETLHNSPYRKDAGSLPTEGEVASARSVLGLREAFVVGYVGTLAPNRGLETTIEALASLEGDVRFLVVGGPETEARRLEELARAHGVGERVRFLGRVPRAEVARHTALFDVAVVLPPPRSRNYLTTLPNKAYDYMAAGVPILASDLPSLRRTLVEEARCAIAVSPDPASVRTALDRLRGSPDRRKELGRNGRDAFLHRYCWDLQEEKFLRLLREVGLSF